MNASNKICAELVCEYNSFEPYDGKTFKGYKLVQKNNLNYYSIVTGLFRYKAKRVSENSYHELHRRCDCHFNESLVNKVAIFQNEEDAYKALIGYHEIDTHKYELAMLEVTIKGDLERAIHSNRDCKGAVVVVGHTIDRVKEIKLYHEKKRNY